MQGGNPKKVAKLVYNLKNYNQFQTITSLNQPCIKHDNPLLTISRIVITHDYLVLLLNSMVINYC